MNNAPMYGSPRSIPQCKAGCCRDHGHSRLGRVLAKRQAKRRERQANARFIRFLHRDN